MNARRYGIWSAAACTAVVLAGMLWVACTQKTPMDPTQSLAEGLPMLLDMSASPMKIKTGGVESTVRVRLVDEKGIPISGRSIRFSTSLGTVKPSEAKTDSGWVATVLRSGDATGPATVTASYDRFASKSISVQIVSTADSTAVDMNLLSEQQELLANGLETSNIVATLIPGTGQSVSGNTIQFATTAGTIQPVATVDASNKAVAVLTVPARVSDVTAQVTATFRDVVKTVRIQCKGVNFSVEANPLTILADGKSASLIRAIVKESSTQIGIQNAEIRFGATIGIIEGMKKTDARGVAEAQLTGTKSGRSVVVVRYGKTLLDTVNVQLLKSAPVYLVVSATPSVVPADGTSQSIIRAVVTDSLRNPVPDGTIVQFDILDGTGTIIRQKGTVAGVAESVFTPSTKPDTAKISVRVGTLSDMVVVYSRVGDADHVLVSSSATKLPADGITNAKIQARVLDSQGNPVQGIIVRFIATIGDITPSAPTDAQGIAYAQYSSSTIGNATVSASIQRSNGLLVAGTIQIQLLPGNPQSIQLRFFPEDMGVKETGQNQTVTVTSDIRDSKNNAVVDGTLVKFSIYAGPGGGESLSANAPVPTVGGLAKVSFSSGIRAGAVRIQAEIMDSQGNPLNPPVKAISTKLIIHAGPPYMENVSDIRTTHLTIVAKRLNIWAGLDTTLLTFLVGDKYNNPVEPGTAVYTTPSGGVATTVSYTNEQGIANDTLFAGNPQPTIKRFYNYIGVQDPNLGTIIPGPIPDFERSQVPNFEGNMGENEGVARVVSYSEGIDANGRKARAWDWLYVVFSNTIQVMRNNSKDVFAAQGNRLEYLGTPRQIEIVIWDHNGNPISSGSLITAEVVPGSIQAGVSWKEWRTDNGTGQVYYPLTITNAIDPQQPKPGWAQVKISVKSPNGVTSTWTELFYVAYP